MVKCFLNRRMLITVATMLIFTISLSSCEPLRKKFTRKKKQDQNQSIDFQPVLEPQDYPAPDKDPKQIYMQHYALIKVWYKDLWSGISERSSDGAVNYSLKQIFGHIDQVKLLLKADKAQELNQLVELLKFYRDSLDQPRPVRNYSRIQSDLRAFDRMLRGKFRYDVIKDNLITQ